MMKGFYPVKSPFDDLNRRVLDGGKTVVSLCRPPGHHCDTKMSGGYCYVNNAVVAVHAINYLHNLASNKNSEEAPQLDVPKIAILDIDFHHGNGTQDYFYNSDKVLYTSIHGQDEYPYYSGHVIETGAGAGDGFNFNFPLPPRSSASKYLKTLDLALAEIKKFDPKYLVASLGFDTFHLDPLGGFNLDTSDYETIAKRIRSELGGIPCLILLEGGYVIDRLGENLLSFLKGWGKAARYGSDVDSKTNSEEEEGVATGDMTSSEEVSLDKDTTCVSEERVNGHLNGDSW
jgi:acetoin utilization deacetylase AcuC-like enzyme